MNTNYTLTDREKRLIESEFSARHQSEDGTWVKSPNFKGVRYLRAEPFLRVRHKGKEHTVSLIKSLPDLNSEIVFEVVRTLGQLARDNGISIGILTGILEQMEYSESTPAS